ncbi:MAG: PIN domain-containing protein [Spartobacteria bacterium]|nr:PIN domain-containing protein [Spartobacteria bacterium]
METIMGGRKTVKGLDTNILVRYLVQDHPKQFAAARRELESSAQSGERFVISPFVLCELVWVLETAYDCSKEDVVDTLEQVLRTFGKFSAIPCEALRTDRLMPVQQPS